VSDGKNYFEYFCFGAKYGVLGNSYWYVSFNLLTLAFDELISL